MTEPTKARRRHTPDFKLETMASDLLKTGSEFWSKGLTDKANECKRISDELKALAK
jgi:hypothetical protein